MSAINNSLENFMDLKLVENPTPKRPTLPCTCRKKHCRHRIAWAKLYNVPLSPIVNVYTDTIIKINSSSHKKVQFNKVVKVYNI